MKYRRLLLLAFLFALPLVGFGQLSKYQALYLYNFTRYVEWPADCLSGNFIIGIIGTKTQICDDLRDIASKRKAGNQTIEIVEYRNAKEIQKCHIIFVPENKMSGYDEIIEKTKDFNTLIVTAAPSFPNKASINFIFDGTKLRYDINTQNAKAAGLNISEKLSAVSK